MATTDDYKEHHADSCPEIKPVYVLHGEEGFFIDRIAEEHRASGVARGRA
ncbi:MAG: hypothetical protein IPP83_00010 [Flavobacteriales bacterium]|nr:hypothetical protein [Flavobacteriales bacterium]